MTEAAQAADAAADLAVAEEQNAIIALATAQNYTGLQDYVLKSSQPPEVIIGALWTLLSTGLTRPSYLIAKLLHLRGVGSPIISFALYFGGIEMAAEDDIALG